MSKDVYSQTFEYLLIWLLTLILRPKSKVISMKSHEISVLEFSPRKAPESPFDLAVEREGKPLVIVWTNMVMYSGYIPSFKVWRKKRVLNWLTYMGVAAILVGWSRPFEIYYTLREPWRFYISLVTIGLLVSEEKLFEIDDARRTTEHTDTTSFTGDFGSCELTT